MLNDLCIESLSLFNRDAWTFGKISTETTTIANLCISTQYGLYAAIMPGFIYALMGTCPQLVDGSTGLTGILVAEFALLDPAYAVFMSLVNGVVITLLAVFRLGNRCLIVRGKRELESFAS